MNPWLHAMRLRTLPLASTSIILGACLAALNGGFRPWVMLLALSTALLLQILSNLANDYGDSQHGADHEARQGPKRAVQLGLLSQAQMRQGIVLSALLSVLSGLALLGVALGNNGAAWLSFIALGALSVLAAITYTMGKKPYGYAGLGDISVLMFFGWLGVLGSAYLHQLSLPAGAWWVATANGLLAVAVLNVNNLRDIESDRIAGKRSVALRLGAQGGRYYHVVLVFGALLCYAAYLVQHATGFGGWAYLLPALMLLRSARVVWQHHEVNIVDAQLKQTAKWSFILALVFSAGLLSV